MEELVRLMNIEKDGERKQITLQNTETVEDKVRIMPHLAEKAKELALLKNEKVLEVIF